MTAYTWLVSKLGNDANTGHASTYPIDLASDAKLTIGAAVAAAASGDTILIWPGTYDEQIGGATGLTKYLNFVGINKYHTIISYASGFNPTMKLKGNTSVKNLTVRATDPNVAIGIASSTIDQFTFEDCIIKGTYDGLSIYGASNVLIKNCYIEGTYDAFNFAEAKNVIVEKCIFKTLATYANTGELRAGHCGKGDYIFRDCIFKTAIDARVAGVIGGLVGNAGSATEFTLISCINCVFDASNSTNQQAFGVKANNYCQISLANCNIRTKSTTGLAYDLYIVTGGKIVVVGCAYTPAQCYGKPTNLDSRWVQAIRETVPVGIGL